jgi:hypothetical protein
MNSPFRAPSTTSRLADIRGQSLSFTRAQVYERTEPKHAPGLKLMLPTGSCKLICIDLKNVLALSGAGCSTS